MQGKGSKSVRRFAMVLALACAFAVPAWARDPARVDRQGAPRSERAQWVYRIVAKWGGHVQEAYRVDPRRWADSMGPVFARAPLPALRAAAEARGFAAMNDALLATSSPAGIVPTRSKPGGKALGDPGQDLVYVPVTPCRILDTRIAGGPIAAGTSRDFDITDVTSYSIQGGDSSNCGVGDKGDFAAAAINITAVYPAAAGYVTAYPHLAARPNAATINYVAGEIRNSLAIARLDQSQATYELTIYSYAQTHVVADIVGYFREPVATALSCVTVSADTVSRSSVFVALSPSCPAEYTIVGGGCYPAGSSLLNVLGSQTNAADHQCYVQRVAASGSTQVTVSARCCRIPGR